MMLKDLENRWVQEGKSTPILSVPIISYTHLTGLSGTNTQPGLPDRDLISSRLHRWVLAMQCDILLRNSIWPFHPTVAPQGLHREVRVLWCEVLYTHINRQQPLQILSPSPPALASYRHRWEDGQKTHKSTNQPLFPWLLPHSHPATLAMQCQREQRVRGARPWGEKQVGEVLGPTQCGNGDTARILVYKPIK